MSLDVVSSTVDGVLICFGSTYMAFTIPILLVCVYILGQYYLKTSKPLRLIDLEAKTPVLSLLSETVDGIETIRAFRWQDQFQETALEKLEASQRPYYLMLCIQRWLNLVLDLLTAGLGVIVLSLAVLIPSSTDAGFLGVALTSVLSFSGGLRQCVDMWTTMETQIASVTRTRTFAQDTPDENKEDVTADPAISWPAGNIRLTDLTVKFE
jgi:ATP-binding cassette, subfamily C (CFTR/MRP), member 1